MIVLCFAVIILLSTDVCASSLKKFLDFIRLNPLQDEAQYFNLTSGCIESFYLTRTTQGNPPRYCRMNNIDHSAQLRPLSKTRCVYVWTTLQYFSNGWEHIFDMTVNHEATCSGGGADFTVYLEGTNGSRYVDCRIVNYKNTYSFRCQVPAVHVAPACYTLHILIDYEYYSAYQDSHTPLLPAAVPINATANFHSVCLNAGIQSPAVPKWGVRDCLTRSPIYFIGSSHMRYVWDAIADQYLDGHSTLLSLPQHHGDASLGPVHFMSNLFVMQLPALLNNLCSSIHESLNADPSATAQLRWRVVLQSLAWDLDYHPIRNVLLYNNSVPALVNTIERIASQRCGQHMDLTWVTAVPVPPCNKSAVADGVLGTAGSKRQAVMACSADSRGYRNNHAISAANEYIGALLRRITLPSLTKPVVGARQKQNLPREGRRKPFVKFVDAFTLIYPTHAQSVCGLHYTCAQHKGRKQEKTVEILRTPGGDAVIDAIIKSVCKV